MKLIFSLVPVFWYFFVAAQPVTGVWRGKISTGKGMFANTCKVELKLIKNGDSLLGTAYYYSNTNSYIRYAVKGYFDQFNNAVHWRDEKMIAIKPVGSTSVGVFAESMIAEADFNCPGNNVMKLDGKSQIGVAGPEFELHFDKVEKPLFRDEWDNVIEGYFTGMAQPEIIDSVFAIAKEYVPYLPESVTARVVRPSGNRRENNRQMTATPGNVEPGPATLAKTNTPKANPDVSGTGMPAATSPELSVAKTAVPAAIKNTSGIPGETGEKVKTNQQPEMVNALPPATGADITKVNTATPGIPASGEIAPADPAGHEKPIAVAVKSTAVVPPAAPAGQEKPAIQQVPVKPAPASEGPELAKTKTASTPVITKTVAAPPASPPRPEKPVQQPVVAVKPSPASAGQDMAKAKTTTTSELSKAVVTPHPAPAMQVNTGQQPATNSAITDEKGKVAGTTGMVTRTTPIEIKPILSPQRVDPVAVRKFETRKKIEQAEIPIMGDMIELNFYDNAEVDGDSISLFLNGKLLFNHVLLSAQAYTFKLDVKDLASGSELVMVAENLGSIPPNTAYMMAIVDGQRYSARLESTEQSSGVIKLVRR